MSAFKRFLTGVTDTGEKEKDERLRTRFFRSEQKKVCREVVAWVERAKNMRLLHTSEERGEVMFEYRNPLGLKHDVVVTVYAVTPVQSAVDVHAALRHTFVDFGYNANLIGRLYQYLEKQFPPVS